jgi:Putative Ig domain
VAVRFVAAALCWFAVSEVTAQLRQPVIITVPPLPHGSVGVSYPTAVFTATGPENSTPAWSIASGALPPGLHLGTDGTLTGIPTAAGTYTFAVSASYTAAATGTTVPLAITVDKTGDNGILGISTPNLAAGTVGIPYPPSPFSAFGGVPSYSFTAQGTLPPGLLLSPAGVLSGTPTAAGLYSFTVSVIDRAQGVASTNVAVQINATVINPLSITAPALGPGQVGVGYPAATFSAAGGTAPYRFSVSAGQLPAGLTLTPAGVIVGIPSAVGNQSFYVQVTDSTGRTAIAGPLTVSIVANSSVSLTANVPQMLLAVLNIRFNPVRFEALNGTPPFNWSFVSGNLPPGLTMAADGTLSGIPTAVGDYSFQVSVIDASSATATAAVRVSVVTQLAVQAIELAPGVAGLEYTPVTLSAAGGAAPYTWSLLSGKIPDGLTLDAGGTLRGTPTQVGDYSFNAQVRDQSNQTASTLLHLSVYPPLKLTIGINPDGTVDRLYSSTPVTPSGGKGPYKSSVSQGSLPPGLTLDPDGTMHGIPSTSGSYPVTITVTDSLGLTATSNIIVTVKPSPVQLDDVPLPAATVGAPYSAPLIARGGTGAYTWSLIGGRLPDGLSLTAEGILVGSPQERGSFTFVARAAASDGLSASRTLTLVVNAPALSGLRITGDNGTDFPARTRAAQQLRFGVQTTAPYPLDLQGSLELKLAQSQPEDGRIEFTSGGRTLAFRIPAGQTNAIFAASPVFIQTGTTATSIVVSATVMLGEDNLTPVPQPDVTVVIDRSPPVIDSATVSRTQTGFNMVMKGFSSTRDVSKASFRFTASAGASLAVTEYVVDVSNAFGDWYRNSASQASGTLFEYTQPFTFSGSGTLDSVSVTLTNSAGTSDVTTVRF